MKGGNIREWDGDAVRVGNMSVIHNGIRLLEMSALINDGVV